MRIVSRDETKSSALVPEKPVRYRMFGRLVMNRRVEVSGREAFDERRESARARVGIQGV